MALDELSPDDLAAAEQRMEDEIPTVGRVTRAFYDALQRRIVIQFASGSEFSFPPRMAQGLSEADDKQLSEIEISPIGIGLHWPQLDADLYVPSLLAGRFGSKKWMAQQLGSNGGKARSPAKTAAVRKNGAKGGRPRKIKAA